MITAKILAFAGSARQDSVNKKLVKIAVEGVKAAGADATYLDFRDLPLPLYDVDLRRLRGCQRMPQAQGPDETSGILIACPEYNSSITPLLKNAIDWASRSEPGEPPLVCFKEKIGVNECFSWFGRLTRLVHVRSILGNIGVLVLPDGGNWERLSSV